MLDRAIGWMPPSNFKLARRPASVCLFSREEYDLPDSPAPRSKSAFAAVDKSAVSGLADPISAGDGLSFVVRRKSQTVQQDVCRADSIPTPDRAEVLQQQSDNAAALNATSTAGYVAGLAAESDNSVEATPLQANPTVEGTVTAAHATAAVTVARTAPTTPNQQTPMQKLRSTQADWGSATSQPWFAESPDYCKGWTISPPVNEPQPEPQPLAFKLDRVGPLAAAVAKLEQACSQQGVDMTLDYYLQEQLQELHCQVKSCRAVAAQQRQVPLTPAEASAAAIERDRFVWTIVEIQQVLCLIAAAHQQDDQAVLQAAEGVVAAFKRQCQIWSWSAEHNSAKINALVTNVYRASFRVLWNLSDRAVLHKYKEDCRANSQGLAPLLQLQSHLIENIYCYNNQVLQLKPRRWNTLGATRLDWTVAPQDLEIVKMLNAAMKVIWKGEYLPAMHESLALIVIVSQEVAKQFRPITGDAFDKMAREYCTRINCLDLRKLKAKDFPKAAIMAAALRRARNLAKRGVVWDGSGSSNFWNRVWFTLFK